MRRSQVTQKKKSPLHKFHYCCVPKHLACVQLCQRVRVLFGANVSTPTDDTLCRLSTNKPMFDGHSQNQRQTPSTSNPAIYNLPSTLSTNRAKENKTHTHTKLHTKPYKPPRPCPLATRRDNTASTTRTPRPRNIDQAQRTRRPVCGSFRCAKTLPGFMSPRGSRPRLMTLIACMAPGPYSSVVRGG